MKAQGKNDLADRTKAFALTVIQMTDDLPRTTSAQVLGKQVLRSATSIGANYREASRGRSKPEFIAKIGDCLREAEETCLSPFYFRLSLPLPLMEELNLTLAA